ncbi:hypothetical protein FH972_016556 [Carpinus fangiana]|uniref:Uncharacterized protein n=1 Tax=Carpinus fangiana TaxID=176857 RepID=A0A5N6RJR3_9ROSI|nr:hypothetical protein FH972_016556 [Carpinus fangiana]
MVTGAAVGGSDDGWSQPCGYGGSAVRSARLVLQVEVDLGSCSPETGKRTVLEIWKVGCARALGLRQWLVVRQEDGECWVAG